MTFPSLTLPNVAGLKTHEGVDLGVTDWVCITQEQINAFAEATGDRQWIHVDVERARRESPFKATIAHGYLTLSLAPALLPQIVHIEGWETAINTGVEKLRFSAMSLALARKRYLEITLKIFDK